MKFAHILLPTDLSEEARRAYPSAEKMARESGGRITLLSVVEDLKVAPRGAPFAPPIGDPDAPQEAQQLLEDLEAERGKLDASLDVQCATVIGEDLGEAIGFYAGEHDCDVIVLSTHGRTGFRRLILGSVAESVLRHAPVPVLCVPKAD